MACLFALLVYPTAGTDQYTLRKETLEQTPLQNSCSTTVIMFHGTAASNMTGNQDTVCIVKRTTQPANPVCLKVSDS